MSSMGFANKHLAVLCSIVLALAGLLGPSTAFSEESSEVKNLRKQADEMTGKIEEATVAYQSAAAAVTELEDQIASNEARIAEIEEKLPEQRERTAASIKTLYLFQQSKSGLIDLILSSETFNDFIATLRYIDTIQSRNTDEVNQLASMDKELKDTQAELDLEYEVAEQKQEEAYAALEEARAAKRALQQRANEIAQAEAKAREEAVAKAQAAIEAAKKKEQQEAADHEKAEQEKREQEQESEKEKEQEQEKENEKEQEQEQEKEQEQESEKEQEEQEDSSEATFTTSSGYTAPIEVPTESSSPSTEPMTTNTTDAETSGWAARIDAYLEGSPLAGYGSTFAKAAAQYGVDPRFSPAISCIESGKGSVCFLPHNAWGWGSSSWPDWETAIYDHVAGLASGYDGTLTLEGAMRYCPPTYQEWYSSVLAEMNSI